MNSRSVTLAVVVLAACSTLPARPGPDRPAFLGEPLSELGELPEAIVGEAAWRRGWALYQHRTNIPVQMARELMGEQSWKNCLTLLRNGEERGVCMVDWPCQTLILRNNGVATLDVMGGPQCARQSKPSFHLNDWSGEGPSPPAPEGLICQSATYKGEKWVVCDEQGEPVEWRRGAVKTP